MSEAAVLERMAPLLEEADHAFRTDPSYVIEIAQRSSEQALRSGRSLVPTESDDV